MDISKFNTESDSFDLFDYVARFSFKTEHSISFSINEEDLDPDSGGGCIDVKGWVDVHYPCTSFYKIHIRIKMPEEVFILDEPVTIDCHPGDKTLSYHDNLLMNKYISKILEVLNIDPNENYEASFILGGTGFLFANVDLPGSIS